MRDPSLDWRNIENGYCIPGEAYCDQPYAVITQAGHWLCVMTTGSGEEGESSQHIVATLSQDKGESWSELIDIEPPGPPESSWATPLITPTGRIYVFYSYNSRKMRSVIAEDEYSSRRVDCIGDFVYKYSDDHGLTWSKKRYTITVREFEMDRRNPYQGKVRFFWSVCKPIIHKDAVYIALAKIGSFGVGVMASSEGAIVRSENILTEDKPENNVWETFPESDYRLKSPAGPVAEEHNLVGIIFMHLSCIGPKMVRSTFDSA